ncbi:MAG: hypothetical protein KDC49_01715 [Saprospiraceae bacterium]|nr:hypothetical protein [Saprospiraceae bacterium]
MMELDIYKNAIETSNKEKLFFPKLEWILLFSIAFIGFIGTVYIVSNDSDLNRIRHQKDQMSMSIIKEDLPSSGVE